MNGRKKELLFSLSHQSTVCTMRVPTETRVSDLWDQKDRQAIGEELTKAQWSLSLYNVEL